MDLQTLAALRTHDGAAALAAATQLVTGGANALVAAQTMRARGWPAELSGAALTQAELRQRAVGKFGADAARMFFTRTGLEQATRAAVAWRRATRVAGSGIHRIADLGCGVGADTLAFARAGLEVVAVEFDPLTAAVASANVAALGLADRVEVRCADATTTSLDGVDALFCDPARRDPAREEPGLRRRLRNPAAYAPAWSFVTTLPARVPATVLKLAPGIGHDLVPEGAEAQWVSVSGAVVEAALWFGPLAAVARRATLLRGEDCHELTGTGRGAAPVGGLGQFLYEPDGAIVRAHLVAELAEQVGGHLADARIAYVFASAPQPTPYGRCFEVVEELPFAVKRLRAALRSHDVGVLEILKRGVAVEPDRLRRDLHVYGSQAATLVLTRVGARPTALLCRPA